MCLCCPVFERLKCDYWDWQGKFWILFNLTQVKKLILNSAIGKQSVLGTTGISKSMFSSVIIIQSKYRWSIANKKLASDLKCTVSIK